MGSAASSGAETSPSATTRKASGQLHHRRVLGLEREGGVHQRLRGAGRRRAAGQRRSALHTQARHRRRIVQAAAGPRRGQQVGRDHLLRLAPGGAQPVRPHLALHLRERLRGGGRRVLDQDGEVAVLRAIAQTGRLTLLQCESGGDDGLPLGRGAGDRRRLPVGRVALGVQAAGKGDGAKLRRDFVQRRAGRDGVLQQVDPVIHRVRGTFPGDGGAYGRRCVGQGRGSAGCHLEHLDHLPAERRGYRADHRVRRGGEHRGGQLGRRHLGTGRVVQRDRRPRLAPPASSRRPKRHRRSKRPPWRAPVPRPAQRRSGRTASPRGCTQPGAGRSKPGHPHPARRRCGRWCRGTARRP